MQCVGKSKQPAERCTKTADRTKGECSTGNKVTGGYREKHKNLKFTKIHTHLSVFYYVVYNLFGQFYERFIFEVVLAAGQFVNPRGLYMIVLPYGPAHLSVVAAKLMKML